MKFVLILLLDMHKVNVNYPENLTSQLNYILPVLHAPSICHLAGLHFLECYRVYHGLSSPCCIHITRYRSQRSGR